MAEKAIELFIEDLARRVQLREASQSADDNSPLFTGLSENCIQTLLSNSFMKNYTADQQIVLQGDSPDYLFYIVEGAIKTTRYGAEGEESTIRMLKTGETFMDAVIFMNGKSPVNAVSLENSRLMLIPADTVRRHALQDAQFACNLLRIVTRHYKNAMQQIDSIVTKNPIERLGYYFLKQHLEQNADSMDFALPFQKSTIANHLGMTPETFSRALSQIKKMGIDVDQEKMTMHDAYVLCHFCDPDTAHICPKHQSESCPLTNDCQKSCH